MGKLLPPTDRAALVAAVRGEVAAQSAGDRDRDGAAGEELSFVQAPPMIMPRRTRSMVEAAGIEPTQDFNRAANCRADRKQLLMTHHIRRKSCAPRAANQGSAASDTVPSLRLLLHDRPGFCRGRLAATDR
jgi:hypothetical protein